MVKQTESEKCCVKSFFSWRHSWKIQNKDIIWWRFINKEILWLKKEFKHSCRCHYPIVKLWLKSVNALTSNALICHVVSIAKIFSILSWSLCSISILKPNLSKSLNTDEKIITRYSRSRTIWLFQDDLLNDDLWYHG